MRHKCVSKKLGQLIDRGKKKRSKKQKTKANVKKRIEKLYA